MVESALTTLCTVCSHLCAISLPLLTQIKQYHHLEEKEKRDGEAFVKRTSNYKTLQVSEEVHSYVESLPHVVFCVVCM